QKFSISHKFKTVQGGPFSPADSEKLLLCLLRQMPELLQAFDLPLLPRNLPPQLLLFLRVKTGHLSCIGRIDQPFNLPGAESAVMVSSGPYEGCYIQMVIR